jgi:hypothetical protein
MTIVYVTIGDSLYCNLHVHAKLSVRIATSIPCWSRILSREEWI